MPLAPGTRLGPYEILGPLGAGGMGEVYRARDTRLERTVAIKVLPEHLSAAPDLKQRFEREARAISALNHPHICTLHDIGSQDGVDYLVMEYLDGETLADRLRRGPLPADQVVKIGSEVAAALDVAHRAGIVHRDLKPGNVMLLKTGAKLMDFGLAKPASMGAGGSSGAPLLSAALTMTTPAGQMSPLTTAGSIVGTIQYMAPEQIEGREADARSDIFALGAVLYEMTTGRRAFEGKSQLSVASAIIEKDPEPLTTAQPAAPRVLAEVVQTCLAKDPEERYASAHDVRLQLRRVDKIARPVAATRGISPRWLWITAVAAAALAVAAGWLALHLASTGAGEPISAEILPPPETKFILNGDQGMPPVLSPDGRYTVVGAAGKLWLRETAGGTYSPLEGTAKASFPFWSPDSRSVAFFADAKLQRLEIHGGAPVVLCAAQSARGGTWGSDNTIVFAPSIEVALARVSASGGTPVPVTVLDTRLHTTHRWPYFLPDGKHFLYLAASHKDVKGADGAIYVGSLDGKETHRLMQSVSNALYSAGHLLFVRDSELMAQRFDAGSLKLIGEPARLQRRVYMDMGIWRNLLSVSDTGLLLYLQDHAALAGLTQWVDDTGRILATLDAAGQGNPRLSPDGKRLALEKGDPDSDIWILEVGGAARVRLTTTGRNYSPVWSPDGRRVLFTRFGAAGGGAPVPNMTIAPVDGAEKDQEVSPSPMYQDPTDWSSDGKYILFMQGDPGVTELEAIEVRSGAKPFPVFQPQTRLGGGRFSPDGKWIAYECAETGENQVYVTPFPGPGPKLQVSTTGGEGPRWRRDGRELYFFDSRVGAIMAVSVTTAGSEVHVGASRKLFSAQLGRDAFYSPAYDVAADGKKFILFGSGEVTANQSPLRLVANWQALLPAK